MIEDNGASTSAPMSPDEEWRRTFIVAINQQAAGEAGHLQADEWAIRAQVQHGHRNPVEVAHEEWWASGTPSSPD